MGASHGKECALVVAERNMMEYRVVVETSTTTLTQSVNSLLNEGWELQGGVSGHTQTTNTRNSIPNSSHQQMWAQAMIKKIRID